MKVAITGSSGYTGSALVSKLKDTNHDLHQFKVEFGPRRKGDNESSEVFMSKFMNPKKTLKDIVKL